jgi:hypothetical protein
MRPNGRPCLQCASSEQCQLRPKRAGCELDRGRFVRFCQIRPNGRNRIGHLMRHRKCDQSGGAERCRVDSARLIATKRAAIMPE